MSDVVEQINNADCLTRLKAIGASLEDDSKREANEKHLIKKMLEFVDDVNGLVFFLNGVAFKSTKHLSIISFLKKNMISSFAECATLMSLITKAEFNGKEAGMLILKNFFELSESSLPEYTEFRELITNTYILIEDDEEEQEYEDKIAETALKLIDDDCGLAVDCVQAARAWKITNLIALRFVNSKDEFDFKNLLALLGSIRAEASYGYEASKAIRKHIKSYLIVTPNTGLSRIFELATILGKGLFSSKSEENAFAQELIGEAINKIKDEKNGFGKLMHTIDDAGYRNIIIQKHVSSLGFDNDLQPFLILGAIHYGESNGRQTYDIVLDAISKTTKLDLNLDYEKVKKEDVIGNHPASDMSPDDETIKKVVGAIIAIGPDIRIAGQTIPELYKEKKDGLGDLFREFLRNYLNGNFSIDSIKVEE